MARPPAFAAILVTAWALGSGGAAAFQEMPVPPPAQPLAIPGQAQGLTFDAVPPATTDGEAREGTKGFSFGSWDLLPKLNFGLELLYGGGPNDPPSLSSPGDPAPSTEDLTIRGSLKRRF